ncbi:histidinol-phosphate transaminase [Olsenella massiliensis]|uniref:histidinol-phosphate transaminase n=1 Tax=Olsenella massiliensis TaxID=1622075 RepID=UPI00071E26AE|nr:histidinol-phosphate transaminase [Olsenella massiliensis]
MALTIPSDMRPLLRPSAAALEPYDPAFSEVRINLSANENTHELPRAVRESLDGALRQLPTNRYPSALADDLRALVADWHGVGPDQVVVGNGGDELLFNLLLAFGGAGRPLLTFPPDFSVYGLYAGLVETPVLRVGRDPETLRVNEAAALEAAPSANLVIVTTPNNPTGDVVSPDFVAALCDACPGVVLADEAYVEFAGDGADCAALLEEHANLAVLRTLSKAYQLAGVRLGYVLANPAVVAALAAVRQPYSVNVLSQAAASVAVRLREEFEPSIREIREQREHMRTRLEGLASKGVRTWPSSANFLLVRLPRAHEVWGRLRDEHSILVRDFSAAPALADCLRITVGTPAENDAVITALGTLLDERP